MYFRYLLDLPLAGCEHTVSWFAPHLVDVLDKDRAGSSGGRGRVV